MKVLFRHFHSIRLNRVLNHRLGDLTLFLPYQNLAHHVHSKNKHSLLLFIITVDNSLRSPLPLSYRLSFTVELLRSFP